MSEPAAGTSRVIVVEDDVLMREGIAQYCERPGTTWSGRPATHRTHGHW